jgi:COP9 signalosome complex subunit 3
LNFGVGSFFIQSINVCQDGNLGLVLQLIEYLPRFYILRLQKRFAAVPVRRVAEWIRQDPNRALALLEELIATGVLNGNIDMAGEPVLRFYSTESKGPLSKSEETLCAELVAQTERTNRLAEYVRLADRKIMFSKDYIEQAKKKATAAENVAATTDLMDTKWELGVNVQDEDIMDAY